MDGSEVKSGKRKHLTTASQRPPHRLFSTQGYTWHRKKRIRKPPPQKNDTLPRLRITLINISKKLKEASPHQTRPGLRRTNPRRDSPPRQKLSSMKKSILTVQAITDRHTPSLTPAFLSTLPRKLDLQAAEELRRPTLPLTALLRRAFNNSVAIRGSHPPETRIREYVDNVLSSSLEAAALGLLNKLNYLQMLKQRRQSGRVRKRLVFGFNEVRKKVDYIYEEHLPKLVVTAVDVVDNKLPGATNDQLSAILDLCRKKAITVCFAGTRKEIGLALYGRKGKSLPHVSIVAVLNHMGHEADMAALMKDIDSAKEAHAAEFRSFIDSKGGAAASPSP